MSSSFQGHTGNQHFFPPFPRHTSYENAPLPPLCYLGLRCRHPSSFLPFVSSPREICCGGMPPPLLSLPHALDLKCRRTAIGIMQKKTWSERGPMQKLRRLRSAFISNGGSDVEKGKLLLFLHGVEPQERGRALQLNRDGHIWLLATAMTARLQTVGAIGVLPYLDGAVHRVQSLLRQLFQGT